MRNIARNSLRIKVNHITFAIYLFSLSNIVSSRSACRANWNNECHSNDECCSKNCYMEKHWLQGVCHPAKSTIVKDCLGERSNNCTNSVDCCSGYCDKGPESTWLHGICRSRAVRGSHKVTNGKNAVELNHFELLFR